MEAQFTALQNMFTQHMKNSMNQKMKTLANIVAGNMNRIIDQIRKKNAWLTTQVTHLTREIQSIVAAKAILTGTPLVTVTLLSLILDPIVAVAAVERQTPRQQVARRPTLQPLRVPVAPRWAPTHSFTPTPTY